MSGVRKVLITNPVTLLRRSGRGRIWRGAIIAITLITVIGLIGWRSASAATATLVPDADVSSAWPTCSTTCQALMQYSYVDDGTTANTADWVGTGTAGTGGEVLEFGLTTTPGVTTATQVVVNANLRSATLGSSADTVGFALRVNGVLQAVTTVTMTTTFTNYSATFTGSWTQADVDSMQIYLIRNVLGSGNAAGRDDDVQLANAYATLTYTEPVTLTLEQSAYRWFENADGSAPLTFAKANGGTTLDLGFGLSRLSDGSYFTTGETNSYGAGLIDMKVTKFSASGNIIWTRVIGGSQADSGQVVIATSDGGAAVAGHTSSFGAGNNDIFIVKLDSSGTISWSRTWGGSLEDKSFGIIQTTDGGYAVSGRTNNFGAGFADSVTFKLDSSGNLLWSQVWGGSGGLDIAQAIIEAPDGGLIVAGQTASFGTNTDAFVIKYNSTGTLLWEKLWGGGGIDRALDIVVTADNGFIIVGDTESYGSGLKDVFIVKYDSSAAISWSRVWGGTGTDYGYGITQDSSGGFAVAGNTNSYGAGGYDSMILKYDSSGALTWNKTWGGVNPDDIYRDVLQTTDGGFLVYGNTNNAGAGGHDALLVKYDSTGTLAGCDSTMCQTPVATASSVSVIEGTVSATLTSPVVTLGNPSPSISSPSVTETVVVAATPNMDVAAPLAASGNPATAPASGTPFRLRKNIHVGGASLAVGGAELKLQVAERGIDGVCDTSFTNETYTDVSDNTGAIRFYSNTNGMDDQNLAVNANDPTHGSDVIVRQAYEESNNFRVNTTIGAGQDGLWDFSLVVHSSARGGASYCFRVVTSADALLNTYSSLPEINIGTTPTLDQQLRGGQSVINGVKNPLVW